MNFTKQELEIILESLRYAYKNMSAYSEYPSYQFKHDRLAEVEKITRKAIQMKRDLKKEAK